MSQLKSLEELFAGRHFDREVIILCVRWYLRYKLSLRDLVEMMGVRTEKSRLRRVLMRLQDQMRQTRHWSIPEQWALLNQMLRGHYAYYGVAGNFRSLQRVYRVVELYWRKMLSSRSWKGKIWWKHFAQIKTQFPIRLPKLHYSYSELQAIAVL